MAPQAVMANAKIAAPFFASKNDSERSGSAGWTGAMIIRKLDLRPVREIKRTGSADDPEACEQRHRHDRGNAEQNPRRGTHVFFPAIKARSIGSRRKATPVAA